MKHAIFIIGHFRSALKTKHLKYFLKYFINKLKDVDIFIYTWDKYEAVQNTYGGYNQFNQSGIKFNKELQQSNITECQIRSYAQIDNNIKNITIINQDNIINDIIGKDKSFMGMRCITYLNKLCGEECKKYTEDNNIQYSSIIRMRPDIYKFIGFTFPINMEKYIKYILNNIIEINNNYVMGLLYLPNTAMGDNFYVINLENYNKLFENLNNKFDEILKKLPYFSAELMHGYSIKSIQLKNKCTNNPVDSLFWKFLFIFNCSN